MFLPAFSNQANRALAAEIDRLQKHLGTADNNLLDNTDTIKVLHEHLGRIQRDVQLASQKLTNLSQGFCKDEHNHQMDLRHLASLHSIVQMLYSICWLYVQLCLSHDLHKLL